MSPLRSRPHVTRAFVLMVLLPAWCLLLFAARMSRAGGLGYGFLLWNLVLAIAPAAAALQLVRAERHRASLQEQSLWALLWLLFLPNAPYIVTDFMHLRARPPVPIWFDIALLASFAGTGLALCYGSVADVQAVVARRFGNTIGWALALAALLLSGLGIYLGRFGRWNSWDALTRPHHLFADLAAWLAEPQVRMPGLRVTLVYGVALVLGYAAVRLIAPQPPGGRSDTPPPGASG